MRKKLFTLLLAIVACIGTTFAWDYKRVQIGDLYYNLDASTQTAEVTFQNSSYPYWSTAITTATIPASVTHNEITYSVTSIGNYAFEGCSDMTSVTIPNSVTSIGYQAFYNCTGLTSVYISDMKAWCTISFRESSANPLYYAHNLYLNDTLVTDLVIPNGVTSIGNNAFYRYSSLTSVTIPNSVTSIGSSAFYNCSGLTFVTIPISVTSIGNSAFENCRGLTSLEIPNSVTDIGGSAFYNVPNIVYNGTATGSPWGAISVNGYVDGYWVYEDSSKTILLACSTAAEGDIVVPNSVVNIGAMVFSYCNHLTSVTITKSVASIAPNAFILCDSLTAINVTIENPNYCSEDGILFNKEKTTLIHYPRGKTEEAFDIPNYVTIVGKNAFYICEHLKSVNIPNSIKYIGERGFYKCTGLTSITIPNSIDSIGYQAFYNCTGLTKVYINDLSAWCKIKFNNFRSNPICYAHSLYLNGKLIKDLVIPNDVKKIQDYAFYECDSLRSITLPNSIDSIGYQAFNNCTGLNKVHIDDLSAYCHIFFNYSNSNPICYAHSLYLNGKLIKDLVIPDDIEKIQKYAFYGCDSLRSITIPNSVASIGDYAFYNCSKITSITNYAATPQTIESNVWWSVDKSSCTLYIPSPSSNLYKAALGWKDFSNIDFLPCYEVVDSGTFGENNDNLTWELFCDGVLKISGNGSMNFLYDEDHHKIVPWYSKRYDIRSVVIEHGVTSIGDSAFYNCSRMTSVTIPNSVTSIGEHAFWSCDGLTSVTIPNSVTSIGKYAFSFCSSLTSVTIPNSVTSIGNSAFCYCTGLTSVTIGDSVTSIGDDAFEYCRGLTSVTIGNSVTSIGGWAFSGCSGLTSVTIGNSVTNIGYSAFSGCSSLTSVIWNAENYTDVRYRSPFDDIKENISSFIFGDDVVHIPAYICNGMTSLKSMTIGSNVTTIGDKAFSDCSSLSSIIWNVRNYDDFSKGESPFNGIKDSITSFSFGNDVKHIPAYLCEDLSGLESMTIPENILTIGNRPFAGCSGLKKVTWNAKKCVTYDDGQYVYPPFQECTNITSFTIGDEVEELPRGLCYGLPIASIIIPKSVKIIGVSAFRDCKNLNSVTIGDNVTTIALSAFYDCKNLTSFTIGKSVNTINNYAFYGCSNLKTINVLPGTPPSITLNTFENISSNACFYVNFGKLHIYLTTDIWKQLNISLLENLTTTIIATATECRITFDIEDINIQSCGIEGGEQQAGNVLEYIGLEPNSEYKDVPIVLTSKEGLTETINVSFKTTALELTTKESKAVSSTTAMLFAETNMSDVETNCGFEWKRENAPESMAGTKVYCPVASGQMAGRLKNLKDDVYYKYRAFYQSTAGNMYYGDWQYIFTGDVTVEFDPVLYTYTASAITETSAIISGYALAGSEDFTEQGFEYWAESRANNGANAPARKPAALGEHVFVKASGINMRVSLTDLDAGTVYKYRAYAKVGDQIYYGSEQSFTTSGTYTPPTYVITFVNWDGTELQSSPVAENTLPEYTGDQPTRPNDEEFSYSFKGWTPEIVIATEDATYTATFEKTTLTAISNIETGTSARKVLRNGQIYILRGEKVYTLTGQAVK